MVSVTVNNGGNPATHFGHQIRKERTARGWSVHEMAKYSGITAGHISRLENGNRTPTERIAEKLDLVFPERKGWFSEYYRDSQAWTPPGYRHWRDYEDKAQLVRCWVGGMIHGLAQTPEYARAHLLTLPNVTPDIVSARLQGRMERQQRLYGRSVPVVHLVDELALYRLTGTPEIMADQMARLLELPSQLDVTVLVVPAVSHAAVHAGITVTESAAYTEHHGGGAVYTGDESVSLRRLIDTIHAESEKASESADIIREAEELWSHGVNPRTAVRRAATALRLDSEQG